VCSSDLGVAGQMFVRLIEVGDDKRLLANENVVAFTDLSFDEAIEFWRRRGGSPEMLDRVLRAYRRNAQEAGDLFLDVIAKKAISQLGTALDQGLSISEFAQSIQDEQAAFGTTPSSPGYLETVYRTNVATAYGEGRYRQMSDPDVMRLRPYTQVRTVDDGRVRPNHQALDLFVFRTADVASLGLRFPRGFNCRCAGVSLSEEERFEEGLDVATSIPSGANADPGF
jgi:SPP1 gp7 family putative phage head morphogenesis protein